MAYTDPGSGVMFLQIIFAAAIGIAIKVRVRVARFFRSKSNPPDELPKGDVSISR